jgi:exosortase/archaeosortase family protein
MAGSVKAWTALLAIQVAVYLPIWKWYLTRMTDGSDEPWGLVALATALIVFLVNREKRTPRDSDLLLPSMLIVAYAATYWFVPRLVQATIAVIALGCTVSAIALAVRIHVPTLGLLVLSLPILPSLQFYLGYPIRVLCGSLTAPLLQLGGIAVVREGTSLRWGSEIISIDAPCSGVRMLWAGLFLAFALSSLFKLSPLRTMLAAGAAVCAVILGNVWRSAALFYLESNILIMPEWCHEAVGVAIFAGVAIFILWIADRLRGFSEFPVHRTYCDCRK